MKLFRRCQRILILALLCVSVFTPVVFVSQRLKNLTPNWRNESIEDLSNIKYRTDSVKLSVEQESSEGLKEPRKVLYEDTYLLSAVNYTLKKDHVDKETGNVGDATDMLERTTNGTKYESNKGDKQLQQRQVSSMSRGKKQLNKQDQNVHSQSRKVIDERIRRKKDVRPNRAVQHDQNAHSNLQKVTKKINEMKDQVIRAKAYLSSAPPSSKSSLVKELKLQIKEVERAIGGATKDSDLSKSALQRMRKMESSLSKARRTYPDCSSMSKKLRAMTQNAEEQIQSQKKQVSFLFSLASSTTPKGLHCLSMQLTAEYFALAPKDRQFPNQQKLHDSKLYHYAVFSDNVLGCTVVVNSTVSTALKPEKIVFHVVTDALNFPAISMWFLLNPPGKATIQVQSIDSFEWLSTKYNTSLRQNSSDPRYSSELNHLRFYLPDIFPALNKIVLFDHDVVVQKDLSKLWSVDMKGKVNGAVETCRESETSFLRMDTFINFSDPFVAKRFDANACTWAFGMNLFDLQEWRRKDLTTIYDKYLKSGYKRPLWVAGSLPLGWITFYNQTVALDRRWHILGLGYNSGVVRADIDRAAVIHYDGIMKPWLDIAIARYKDYWRKYVNYDDSYLQRCNIHA
ncbi:hypothetical protein ACFX13_036576 [Malus domestica]